MIKEILLPLSSAGQISLAGFTVTVYKLAANATFREMLGSLSKDLSRLCLTDEQIERFEKDYREWLRPDKETFFLTRKDSKLVVVAIRSGVIPVTMSVLENYVWRAQGHYQLVTPYLV